MIRACDLGRLIGIFIPSIEVEAHLACGWLIADDMVEAIFACDEVLMIPPERRESEAA